MKKPNTTIGPWRIWQVAKYSEGTEKPAKKIGKPIYKIGRVNKGTLEWYEDPIEEPELSFTSLKEAKKFLKEIEALERGFEENES